MPKLELGDLRTKTGRALTILHIAAVMGWPNPDDPQQAVLRRRYLRALRHGLTVPANPERPRLAKYVATPASELGEPNNDLHRHIDRQEYMAVRVATWIVARWPERVRKPIRTAYVKHGGLGTLIEARKWSEFEAMGANMSVGWTLAAETLVMLCRLAHSPQVVARQATVNKALYILRAKQLPGLPTSRSEIVKLWREFKPVAHLCTAIQTWGAGTFDRSHEDFEADLFENTRWLLAAAKEYENFMVESFIKPEEIWSIPVRVRERPIFTFPLLTGPEMSLLRGYSVAKAREGNP